MQPISEKRLLFVGGISGFIGTLLYIAAITIPLNVQGSFFVATMWPVISIVFVLAMYRLIEREQPGIILQLSFLFSVIGFSIVACMLGVQLAVQQGTEEYRNKIAGFSAENWDALSRSLRMVDLGLDVVWDLFIGCGLFLLGIAMLRHSRFKFLWGGLSSALGVTLIGLNVATFPWPPDSRGLFDIGPFIGVYLAALSIRMVIQGSRTAST